MKSTWLFISIYSSLIDQAISQSQPNRLTSPYPSGQIHYQANSIISTSTTPAKSLIPVALGVMSKCPDAQICEDVFDRVLTEVSSKVDLTMVYMGNFDASEQYGVQCRHGPMECRANIQQLCYRAHHPILQHWWSFIQCQNYAGLARVGDEDLARSCAKLNGHDWDEIQSCVEGNEGLELLHASVREALVLPVLKSCSIYINRRMICMHDSSWKQCPSGHAPTDFIKLIESEYKKINS
ncbi:secreted protein [Melampsora americana]|nr:secreted protein [Melampsora americana]